MFHGDICTVSIITWGLDKYGHFNDVILNEEPWALMHQRALRRIRALRVLIAKRRVPSTESDQQSCQQVNMPT